MDSYDELRENSTEEVAKRYRDAVKQMARYLPWLKSHASTPVFNTYHNDRMSNTMSFPVYDSTLLSFVREFQRTNLVNRNYVYVYSRNHLKTAADELQFIERAELKNIDDLRGILSRYVLEGNVRGAAWSEGVSNGVLCSAIEKLKDIIEFWGKEPKGRG